MVVIARHRDDAERRAQARERAGERDRNLQRVVRAVAVDEVARDQHDVRVECVHLRDDAREPRLVHCDAADVDVAQHRGADGRGARGPVAQTDGCAAYHRISARVPHTRGKGGGAEHDHSGEKDQQATTHGAAV